MAIRNSHKFVLLTALLLPFLAGCAKPASDYFFVSTETARSQGSRYNFTLNLDDTTANYTVRIAARLVASRLPDRQIAFDIHTTSPFGETAIERKAFSLSETGGNRMTAGSGSVVDCEWPWRESVRLRGTETGSWHISIAPTDTTQLDAFYGIGISYETDHGKR